jgi:putative ABC transport system permease protein
LIGAGLLVRGFSNLARSESAFKPETLLTMRMALTDTRYPEDRQVVEFYDQLLERLHNVRGASAFGAVTYVPHGQSRSSWSFVLEGQQPVPPGAVQIAQTQSISPGYFRAMQIPVLEGRDISAADGPNSPRVAIVSHAFVRRYLPNEKPVGKRLRFGSGEWFEIVGVTGDIRHDSMEKIPRPAVYRSYRQVPTRRMDLVFRAMGKPEDLIAAARAQVYAIDQDQPVYDIKTLAKVIADERTGISYVTVIMALLGLIALVLSAVGVYGVMAHSVSERTHEIGVRMALGAYRADVLKMVLSRGMTLAGIGLVAGLAGGYALAQLLAGLIFGVQAGDPVTFVAAVAVLLLVAGAACYLPARRAAQVDPMIALRYE